jgi:hypothetical protein
MKIMMSTALFEAEDEAKITVVMDDEVGENARNSGSSSICGSRPSIDHEKVGRGMKSFLVSGEEFTLDYSSDAESYESSSSSN